eukprot:TRINITY_DN5286_c0_g1_i5.p1 TRINITY_DN5286_c0_g1~~TRINITY_DN5286_c0_g1_i5.p1  ORF type:complete len:108 (-),score=19.88 TRINITY_DN5286_c0_g1_i5:255-578(-)
MSSLENFKCNRVLTDFFEVYYHKLLGSGTYGRVYAGVKKSTGEEVAVKTVYKARLSESKKDNIYREISILSSCSHPNVLGLLDFFESNSEFSIVLELCRGTSFSFSG